MMMRMFYEVSRRQGLDEVEESEYMHPVDIDIFELDDENDKENIELNPY